MYVANEVVLSKQRRADIIAVVKLKLQNEVKTKKYIKLLILIENKIGSTEHSKQTKEYVEHLSDETKEKLSKAHKGQIPWNTGKCLSNEHRKKISEAKKGLIGLRGSKNHLYGKPAVNRRKVSKYDLNGNFIKKYRIFNNITILVFIMM